MSFTIEQLQEMIIYQLHQQKSLVAVYEAAQTQVQSLTQELQNSEAILEAKQAQVDVLAKRISHLEKQLEDKEGEQLQKWKDQWGIALYEAEYTAHVAKAVLPQSEEPRAAWPFPKGSEPLEAVPVNPSSAFDTPNEIIPNSPSLLRRLKDQEAGLESR